MRKILVLFAHPRFEHSVVNRTLVKAISEIPAITFHDLYEEYPDFNIDIRHEQKLLLEHDVIIWHHPFYWYSCPPLLKQWIDMVLEFNWAYGPGGDKLTAKYIFNTITTGGTREAYQTGGRNRFTVNTLLSPFEQTAVLCNMIYLPPFAVQGTHRIGQKENTEHMEIYLRLLGFLADKANNPEILKSHNLSNDFFISENIRLTNGQ